MPAQRSQPPTLAPAIFALAAALGLAACGSDVPETVQYPATASAPSDDPGATSQSSQRTSRPSAQSGSGPLPTYDGTLAAMVESAIAAEPELNTLGIEVTASEGTIYLRGQARTREARELATQVASRVEGVQRVENELLVSVPSASAERRVGSIANMR